MFWEVRINEPVPDFQTWFESGGIELLIDQAILEYIHSEAQKMGSVEREFPAHRTVVVHAALEVSTVDDADGRRPRQLIQLRTPDQVNGQDHGTEEREYHAFYLKLRNRE